jgi:hypothetical protein
MNIHLVVVKPFAGLARGDVVTDEARVSEILRSEQAAHVVRVVPVPQKEG